MSFLDGLFGKKKDLNGAQANAVQTFPIALSRHRYKGKVAAGRLVHSSKRRRPDRDPESARPAVDGLDDIVAQVLDLAQRVHAVASQAEAAVLRAEAAVIRADGAVAKAEAAASRADASYSKSDAALSRVDAIFLKSEASAKRAELAANKAGLAAAKLELSSSGQDTSPASDSEDNRTKKLNNPVSQIALMSMKLRSGMRRLEQQDGPLNSDAPANGESSAQDVLPDWLSSFGREDVASGLVSVEGDSTIPRVAPFIMQPAEKPTAARADKSKSADKDDKI